MKGKPQESQKKPVMVSAMWLCSKKIKHHIVSLYNFLEADKNVYSPLEISNFPLFFVTKSIGLHLLLQSKFCKIN